MAVLARVYHVPPDRQDGLTLRQLNVLEADYRQLLQAAEQA